MCANGVNTEQLLQLVDMVQDHVALEYRWAHRLAHTAGDGGFATASKKLHDAQAMLADVRAMLDEAKEAIESESISAGASNATVKLV